MKELVLENVTLVSVSSVKIRETIKALKYSYKNVEYGGGVLFLSHKRPILLPKKIRFVKIDKISSINYFNRFMVYELYKYIKTDFVLQIHYDGFVVHPELWRDDFLRYDYIGSPWPYDECFKDKNGVISRVGNSVGIRSLRLLRFPTEQNIPFEPDEAGFYNEDMFICCRAKHLFEAAGMKFAPLEVAKYFGKEIEILENKDLKTFLFHKWRGKNSEYPVFGLKDFIKIKVLKRI